MSEPSPEPNLPRGIIAWFVNNPVAVNLLMVFIIIVGIYSALTIKKDLTPEFRSNVISIEMAYPGAATAEVERGIVVKIEEAIKDIESIKSVESTAMDSLARIKVDIRDGYDLSEELNNIKIAVDGIGSFPQQAERPVIFESSERWQAIQLQLYGSGLTEANGKLLAEQIKRELLSTTDISSITIYGTRDYELSVEVSEYELRRYGLTLDKVKQAINRASVDLSAGSLKTANGDIRIRANEQAYRQQDFERIELLTFDDGTRLLLGDIATIKDSFVESSGSASFDDTYSVGMAIYAVGPQDLINIAQQAKDYIERKNALLPSDITLAYWADSTYYLEGRIDMMVKNLAIGALLVFIILGLFMELNIAFWVMLGIPVCFLGTFIVLPFVGVSLNMISLFGFILVLGIVVDDAIIIGESVHTSIVTNGDSLHSVISGTHRVATAATFGVLTTICAFLPTLFVTGTMANFPAACGYVVLFCLIFSLIESKWILPAHIAHRKEGIFSWVKNVHQERLQLACNHYLRGFIDKRYTPFLVSCIRQRYTTLAVFLALLIIILGMMSGGWIRYVMTPDTPNDYVRANVEMVQGTSEDKTLQAVALIKQKLREIESEYIAEDPQGRSFVSHFFSYTSNGRAGFFMIELTKQEERNIDSDQIVQLWRERVGNIVGTKLLSFSAIQENPARGDIAFNLVSDNPDELRAASNALAEKLASYDGLSDIRNGVGVQQEELSLNIKPAAQALGVSLFDIGSQVKQAFFGLEAQRVQRGFDEIKVMVRYPEEQRQSMSALQNMTIRADGDELPLLSVVDIENGLTDVSSTRINGLRAARITAKADKNRIEPRVVIDDVTEQFLPALFAKYPSVSFQLDGSALESKVLEKELLVGFCLALLGIYALLAIPLKSYNQPIIIMSVIPFGLIGAVVGHVLMGMTVSMMSIFGIIALSGVVVNDSLIMVDFINRSIAKGNDILKAVVEAGRSRFRAILLTSLTTFFGVLPILLETSMQAQFVIPMAVSLGFGIIFATVITLLLVPCLYMVLDDLKSSPTKLGSTQQT